MKFKVGDRVRAISNYYGWTKKAYNWEGIVVEVNNYTFSAITIYSENTDVINREYDNLKYIYFELIDPNPANGIEILLKYFINKYKEVFNMVDFKYEIKAKKSILDDVEKEYLSNVIKPFRDRVKYIKKIQAVNYGEFISIGFFNSYFMCLPYFEKGTMYKGMECDKKYTLEELGL